MSTHTIQTEIEVEDIDGNNAYPMIEITYEYSRGAPAFTPRGEYGPIDPPEPPGLEFRQAKLIKADGDSFAFYSDRLQQLAEEWLMDDGYDYACDCAETDLLATRAAHMEYRREQ